MDDDERVYFLQYGIKAPRNNNPLWSAYHKLLTKKRIHRGKMINKEDHCSHVLAYLDSMIQTVLKEINGKNG